MTKEEKAAKIAEIEKEFESSNKDSDFDNLDDKTKAKIKELREENKSRRLAEKESADKLVKFEAKLKEIETQKAKEEKEKSEAEKEKLIVDGKLNELVEKLKAENADVTAKLSELTPELDTLKAFKTDYDKKQADIKAELLLKIPEEDRALFENVNNDIIKKYTETKGKANSPTVESQTPLNVDKKAMTPQKRLEWEIENAAAI